MKEYWNCMFAGILVCLALFITRHSEALTVKPFIYHQDFENGIDPMKFVSARGKYTLNFQGITDEQAFSGKKSFKIDIILDAGGSYTLAIPLDDIPVVDNLKFSGMIRVAEAPPRSPVVLGLDFRYWPCLMETSGTRDFPWNTKYDDWVKISADIPYRAHGQASKFHYFPELFWAVEPENTGIYVARIFLTLFTRATGDITRRFIVYVDDLKIEGEVPDKDEFKKDTEQRWKQVSEKTEKKILEWEGAIKEAEAQISKLTNLSPEAEKLK
ncbi:MAG: DUF4315 family protein, partial [bacterium]|nr:DUF4315 family protein [bacterium]